MLEAHQARQRRKPVRCWFSGKKVPLWMQEGASYGQEAILPVGAWLGSRSEAETGGEFRPHGTRCILAGTSDQVSDVVG